MNKAWRLLVLVVVAAGLSGAGLACNTTEGAGKDLKNAGQGIENSADRNK